MTSSPSSMFRRAAAGHRELLAGIITAQIATGVTRAWGVGLVEPLTNAIIKGAGTTVALYLVLSLVINSLGYITRWLAAIFTVRLEGHALADLRLRMLRRIMRMPMLEFEKRGHGEFVSLIQRDAQHAASWIYTSWSRILTCITTSAFSILLMAAIDPWLTLILVAVTLAAAVLNKAMLARVKTAEQDARQAQAGLTDVVLKGIAAFDVVRVCRAAGFVKDLLLARRSDYDRAALRSAHIDGQRVGLYSILSSATVYASALWMAHRVLHGHADIGQLAGYIALMLQGLAGIETSFRWWSQLTVARASWDRITAICGDLWAEPTAETSHSATNAAGAVKELDIDDRFTYPGADHRIERAAHAGAGAIGVIPGASGSGKTTFLKCLVGLYPFDADTRITIDGAPSSPAALADLISYAPAAGGIIDASVRDNLTLGDPAITTDAIMSAAERLGIAAWLTDYGLDTTVGPGGSQLSGGQRQSLGVLRALLADRPVVVLDEPLSALDPARASSLATALSEAAGERMVIVASHRDFVAPAAAAENE